MAEIKYNIVGLMNQLLIADDDTITIIKLGFNGAPKGEKKITRSDIVSVALKEKEKENSYSRLVIKTQEGGRYIDVISSEYNKKLLRTVYNYLNDSASELPDPTPFVEEKKQLDENKMQNTKPEDDARFVLTGPFHRLVIADDETFYIQKLKLLSYDTKEETKFSRNDVSSVSLQISDEKSHSSKLEIDIGEKKYEIYVNSTFKNNVLLNVIFTYLNDKTSILPNEEEYAKIVTDAENLLAEKREEIARAAEGLSRDEYIDQIKTAIKDKGVFEVGYDINLVGMVDPKTRNILRIYDDRIAIEKSYPKNILVLNYADISSIEYNLSIQATVFNHGGLRFHYQKTERKDDRVDIISFAMPRFDLNEESNVFFFEKQGLSGKYAIYLHEYLTERLSEAKSKSTQPVTPQQTIVQQPSSLADEISKLNELLKSGVISEDEFNAAKKKLLGL